MVKFISIYCLAISLTFRGNLATWEDGKGTVKIVPAVPLPVEVPEPKGGPCDIMHCQQRCYSMSEKAYCDCFPGYVQDPNDSHKCVCADGMLELFGIGNGCCACDCPTKITKCAEKVKLKKSGNTEGSEDKVKRSCKSISPDSNDDVYKLVVGAKTDLKISTNNEVTKFDTQLLVFKSCRCQSECLGANDDSESDKKTKSELTLKQVNPGVYWIVVDGANGGTGAYRLDVTCSCGPCEISGPHEDIGNLENNTC